MSSDLEEYLLLGNFPIFISDADMEPGDVDIPLTKDVRDVADDPWNVEVVE